MLPAPAAAGAWIAPEGGQRIVHSAIGERGEGYFYEGSIYWEVPVGDENSLVFAPWVETAHASEDFRRTEVSFGLKHAFYRRGDSVMAVQGSALWVSDPDPGCSQTGAELRWLGGHAFGENMFLNVETAARALDGGCEGGRVDITTGYRPDDDWLVMGQVFFDAPVEGDETVKGQLNLVNFSWGGRGIQVGVRARIDGGEPEPMLVLGLWGRPGD